jgi:hypothetical protein
MELFKGLLIGEIALLLLGIVFFLVLLFLLVYLIIKKRAYKQMVAFFLLPVNSNPKDTGAKKSLYEKIQKIESRASSDPSAQVALADANLSVGDTLKARQAINKALRIKPGLIPAQKLSRRINNR